MRRFLIGITAMIIPIILLLLLVETALRINPSFIGIALLDRFPASLKSNIARQLDLPTSAEFRVVSSVERYDKGPELLTPKPGARYMLPPEPADAAAGAINYFEVDERGFCNQPGILMDGTPDVIVIGGSVPSCAGVDASGVFTTLLGPASGLRTYDMTVGGVGPYEYVEVLRRFGLDLKPRMVIMAFSEANDLRDCKRYEEHRAGHGRSSRLQRDWGWPFTSSYALSFLKAGVEVSVRSIKAGVGDDFTYSVEVLGKRQPMNIRNGDRDELESARALAEGRLSVSICEPSLSAFVQLARENKFVPVILATPAAYTAYGKSVEFKTAGFGPLMKDFDEKQRAELAANAERIGYIFIDPVKDIQDKAVTLPLLFLPSNAHLTVAGHKLLAETVGPKLQQILDSL